MLMRVALKVRPCKACRTPFQKRTQMHAYCSHACGIADAEKLAARRVAKVEREARADLRARKIEAKPLSYFAGLAEDQVNRYVRLRDAHLGCVSCSKTKNWTGQWHASHFRSVGAATAVRFNLWNIHKACSQCNKWLSGNLAAYEPALRERIGHAKVDWLRSQNQITYYTREYLTRLKTVFAKRCRRLEKRLGL